MKKALSIALSLMMLISLIDEVNFSAYADDSLTTSATTYVGGFIRIYDGYYNDYNYVSENESIATVSSYYYDYIIGVSEGQTRIKRIDSYNNVTYIDVTVKKPSLSVTKTSLTFDVADQDDEDYYIVKYDAIPDGLTVQSSNSNVVSVSLNPNSFDYWDADDTSEGMQVPLSIWGNKKGTATITISDKCGNKKQITVKVTDREHDEYVYEYALMDLYESYFNKLGYGSTSLSGSTLPYATVTLKLNSKTYKTTASKNGYYKFTKLPICKIGTKFSVNYSKKITEINKTISRTINSKVVNPKPALNYSYFYRNNKTFKGTAKNVHKGDVIIIKIGKMTYKKKVTKDAKKFNFSVKVKKAKFGTKIKISIINKYKQEMNYRKTKVYYASRIKTGMTKKQAKCVPGWEDPYTIEHYSYGETWWYDDDGDGYDTDSYLSFNSKGKLIGWMY